MRVNFEWLVAVPLFCAACSSTPATESDLGMGSSVDLTTGAPDLTTAMPDLTGSSIADLAVAGLTIASPAFPGGGTIPLKYADSMAACGPGQNVSPPITFANPPSGTKSFAVRMEDLDFNNYVHWVAWDIPANATQVAEGAAAANTYPQAGEYHPGTYGGPCPPPKTTHRYRITITALTVDHLGQANGAASAAVLGELAANKLAEAQIIGNYTAP